MADQQNNIKTVVDLDISKAQTDIVKLNSAASDSTKTLEERIASKNKAIKIQNELSKKTITLLENERRTLEGRGASEEELMAIFKKINAEKVKAAKLSADNTKALNALKKANEDASNSFKKLDDATGGVISKFKALLTNPIGIVVSALAGIFTAFKTAVNRSGKASETFGKIGAKLSGILNGILAIIEPLVEFLGEKLLLAIEDPKQAFLDLGETIQNGVINRFKALSVLGGAIVKLFKGDFKGAAKDATDGLVQLTLGVTDATDKITEFGETAKVKYNEAAKASMNLANAERTLVKNRIALEKQQLKSLRLAEEERQIRDDTSRSIEERIEANTRLGVLLDEQSAREMAIAQQNLNIARLQQQATGDTIENIEAVGDAELALLEIQERITGQRSEQLTNENALLKEQADLKQAEVDKALKDEEAKKEKEAAEKEAANVKFEEDLARQIEFDEIELERKRINGEATAELEAEILELKSEREIAIARGNAEQIELIEAKKKLALDKVKRSEEKATEDKNKAELDNTINSAAEAFGISQEVAIARMIMAAPEAVGNSFKKASETYPAPLSLAMGALGAAGVVAPIIKGLSDIKNTRFSKSKGSSATGSVSTSSLSAASTASSSVSPEVINDLSSNNSANVGFDSSLASSSTADAANNINGSSSLGVVFSESRYQDFQNQVKFKEDKTTI